MNVKAEGVSKRYFRKTGGANYFYAVQPASLEIAPGEVTVLTGRSGSGKTTLMNMLSGLLAPSSGKVWVDGTDLYALDDKTLSRWRSGRIGIVPQGRSAVDTLTALENILLPARLYRRPLPEKSAAQWMELAQEPDILFADEPTGDLDDENTRLVLSAFRDYAHEKKKAVFMVTHENDALLYADRVYKMDGGRIVSPAGQTE